MVRATFKINKAFHCGFVRLNASEITAPKGAWLNHTTKVMKKAIQDVCRVRMLGFFKLSTFNFELSTRETKHSMCQIHADNETSIHTHDEC